MKLETLQERVLRIVRYEGTGMAISRIAKLFAEYRNSSATQPVSIVIEEIQNNTGPTGGWLNSPKAVCAEIVARLEGGAAREPRKPESATNVRELAAETVDRLWEETVHIQRSDDDKEEIEAVWQDVVKARAIVAALIEASSLGKVTAEMVEVLRKVAALLQSCDLETNYYVRQDYMRDEMNACLKEVIEQHRLAAQSSSLVTKEKS